MTYPLYRRFFGLLLGAAAGFGYALVSQGINHLFLPGIPLYQPPFGAVVNTLLAALFGALLGAATAWAESGGVSLLWGSLLGALCIALSTLLTGQSELSRKAMAVAVIFLPLAGAVAVPLLLFRWAIGREEQAYRNTRVGLLSPHFWQRCAWQNHMRRYALPAGLVLVAGVIGLSSLYNDFGRAVTPQMHRLIQQGMQAQSAELLPAALRPPDVRQFAQRAQGVYTLQWDKDEANQFAIPRPASNMTDQSTVIARFADGYVLACMFPGKTGLPTCRDF